MRDPMSGRVRTAYVATPLKKENIRVVSSAPAGYNSIARGYLICGGSQIVLSSCLRAPAKFYHRCGGLISLLWQYCYYRDAL